MKNTFLLCHVIIGQGDTQRKKKMTTQQQDTYK